MARAPQEIHMRVRLDGEYLAVVGLRLLAREVEEELRKPPWERELDLEELGVQIMALNQLAEDG